MNLKVKLSKETFYIILVISCLLIFLITINAVIDATSHNYKNNDEANKFTLVLIVRTIVNSIVIIFFVIYSYLAFTKIEIGYVYCLFWSFVMMGNILSVWLLKFNLSNWYKILSTIICSCGIMTMFYQFVLIRQINFYHSKYKKWGGK